MNVGLNLYPIFPFSPQILTTSQIDDSLGGHVLKECRNLKSIENYSFHHSTSEFQDFIASSKLGTFQIIYNFGSRERMIFMLLRDIIV
jgi:hypothetical protein